MKCPKCGKEIANDSIFCEYCGNPIKKSHKNKLFNLSNIRHSYKKLLAIIVVTICGLILYQIGSFIYCSMRSNSKDIICQINFLPCEIEDTDEKGVIDEKGRFTPFKVDEVPLTINNYCFINSTLYKVGDSICDTIPILRNLESCGIMNEDLIPICREDEYISLVNSEGKEVFQLKEFNGEEVLGCFYFSDSKLRVILDDTSFIYVDKRGNQLFNMKYTWATDFRDGHAIVQAVNQNENLYSFVDGVATPIFTFESESWRDIVVSYDMQLLSAKENKKIVIYNFDGKRILECPSKVCQIYSFCRDGIIYYNEDDDMGLMTYKGETLIRPRYKQLVPHGNNYLARNDDDIVRLINKNDNIIKEFDGERIWDFQRGGHDFSVIGYEFPNVVETPDEDCLIIDADGNVLKEGFFLNFDMEDIEERLAIESSYFPSEKVLTTIMDLCGDSADVSNKYGAFLNRLDTCCTPRNITFLSSPIAFHYSDKWKYGALHKIEAGVNYDLQYGVVFDEPIVEYGGTELNTTACLFRVEIYIGNLDFFRCIAFQNQIVNKLSKAGYEIYYNKGRTYLLHNKGLMYVVFIREQKENEDYKIVIYIIHNTDDNRTWWKERILKDIVL